MNIMNDTGIGADQASRQTSHTHRLRRLADSTKRTIAPLASSTCAYHDSRATRI
jgi:hypothetical protein